MLVTLSQDILAICLVLSGGDLDMKLENVVKLAEEFQEDKDRHFGITRSDFRTLLMRLIWEKIPGSIFRGWDILNDVKLREVTLDMLRYQDAGFNDEVRFGSPDKFLHGHHIDRRLYNRTTHAVEVVHVSLLESSA